MGNDDKGTSADRGSNESAVNENEELRKIGRFPWKTAGRVLTFRIPIWLIVVVILAVSGIQIYRNITTVEPVNLRPIISEAKEIEIRVVVCDKVLEDNDLEVLATERKIEERFIDRENVGKAKVRIDRAPDSKCLQDDEG